MKIKNLILFDIENVIKPGSYQGLSLGYLKATIQKSSKNINTYIFQENILSNIYKIKPEIIGIASTSYAYDFAIDIAKIIRDDFPNMIIILGGPHISALPLTFDQVFDFGIIGEGEMTMAELVSGLEGQGKELDKAKLKDIKGICFFNKKKIIVNPRRELLKNIDLLPHIKRVDFKSFSTAYLFTQRGCPYQCQGCGGFALYKSRLTRFHSAKYIYEEILGIVKEGIFRIDIRDELFAQSKDRLRDLISLIKSDNKIDRKIDFTLLVRPEVIDNETCELLKDLGVSNIEMIIGSGSKHIIEEKFCQSEERVLMALRTLQSWKFRVRIFFSINNDGESEEDIQETLKFIKIAPFDEGRVKIAHPVPGTASWEQFLKKNRGSVEYNNILFEKAHKRTSLYDFFNMTKMSNERLLENYQKIEKALVEKNKSRIQFLYKFLKMSTYTNKYKRIEKRLIFYYRKLFPNYSTNFPEFISIRMTNRCNYNCFFCLNANFRKQNMANVDFSFKHFIYLLEDLAKYKPNIYLAGGEPTLNKDLFKIISILRLNNVNTYIYTNGYLIQDKIVDILRSDMNSLTLSIDHHSPVLNDKTRGLKGGFGKSIKGFRSLMKMDVNNKTLKELCTVINKNNYKSLADIYDFVVSLGKDVNSWQMNNLIYINANCLGEKEKFGIGNITEGLVLKKDERYFNDVEVDAIEKQFDLIKVKERLFNIKVRYPYESKISKYYSNAFPKSNSYCVGINRHLHIVNNKICIYCGDALAEVTTPISLYSVWNSKINREIQKYVKKNMPFKSCYRCSKIRNSFS